MARGSITELGPDKWRVRFDAGLTQDGRRRQASKVVYGGRRAAEKALAELIRAESKIQRQSAGTLRDFIKSWLQWKESAISPKTLSVYEASLNRIPDAMLRLPLKAIDGRKLDELYRMLIRNGASPYVVRQVHAALRSAFTTAVKWDLVELNPASKATPPSIPRSKVIAPTAAEVAQVVELTADRYGRPMAAFFALAAMLGTRRGELLALKRSDLDFENRRLAVSKSLVYVPNKGSILKSTKTGEERSIALDEIAISILRSRLEELVSAAEDGFAIAEDPYIFASDPTGDFPWHPDWPTHAFSAVCKSLDLSYHLHQLRHFTATQLIAAGVDIRTVSSRLGHADPSITLKVYSHSVQAADIRAAAIIGEIVSSKNFLEQSRIK